MAKFLVVGTLVGAIFLFVSGGVLHNLPYSVQGLNEFRGGPLVVEGIRAAAGNGNGIYFAKEGILAAVHFEPGVADRTANIGPLMVKEVVTDLASAFLLCLVLLAIKCTGTWQRAGVLATAALAACMENQISDWNWYGFSGTFTIFEMVDIIGSWFALGLILSVLNNKFAPSA